MNETIKVLTVDDDPDVLFATSRIVRAAGYESLEAMTGLECMEKARQERPDLILMDVVLPDIKGSEICRQIKDDPFFEGTFVVLMSEFKTSSVEQAEGLNMGADGYIARPISNQELKARINAMVRILIVERERDRLILELGQALAKIKQLSGLLPICSYCNKIRDDKGHWNRLERYIQKHSEARFSHSICPECTHKHFPEFTNP